MQSYTHFINKKAQAVYFLHPRPADDPAEIRSLQRILCSVDNSAQVGPV